jgi:dipeptidyl aminopeptidase/acylaminoacyl peptidase
MRMVVCLCMALAVIAPAFGQEPSRFEEHAPYRSPPGGYEDFVHSAGENFPGPFDEAGFRRDHPVEDWRLVQRPSIQAETMSYRVDGLRITGAFVRPRHGLRQPILIWARGGVGAARLDHPQMVEMAWWAAQGYAVYASNYRGAGGSEGADEFAGADVNDLRVLAEIAAHTDGVDRERMYALGFSRGGLMLFRAVAEGMPVRAFATAGAPSDLHILAEERPDLDALFSRMMPDYAAEHSGRFCARSPLCWPDRIGAPVLIAHGANDRAIPPDQSWRLAQALNTAGKPHRFILYGESDHGLGGARRSFFEAAHAFFQSQP